MSRLNYIGQKFSFKQLKSLHIINKKLSAIEKILIDLPVSRERMMSLIKLEELEIWITKAIARNENIEFRWEDEK